MWGTIISVAGNVLGGVLSRISNKKAQQAQEQNDARRQAYLEMKANEDPLSRSDTQALLAQQRRENEAAARTAAATAKITGATPEYQLAVQKNNANAMANTIGNIAAGASAQRDKYEEQLDKARSEQAEHAIQFEQARQQNIAQMMQNAAKAGAAMIDGGAGHNMRNQPRQIPSEPLKPTQENMTVQVAPPPSGYKNAADYLAKNPLRLNK